MGGKKKKKNFASEILNWKLYQIVESLPEDVFFEAAGSLCLGQVSGADAVLLAFFLGTFVYMQWYPF